MHFSGCEIASDLLHRTGSSRCLKGSVMTPEGSATTRQKSCPRRTWCNASLAFMQLLLGAARFLDIRVEGLSSHCRRTGKHQSRCLGSLSIPVYCTGSSESQTGHSCIVLQSSRGHLPLDTSRPPSTLSCPFGCSCQGSAAFLDD